MKTKKALMYVLAASLLLSLFLGLYAGTKMAERDNSLQQSK